MRFFLTVLAAVAVLYVASALNQDSKGATHVCVRCLCKALTDCKPVGCNKNKQCGPFLISWEYWNNGGKSVPEGYDPDTLEAFKACANDLSCAEKTVKNFVNKYAEDCDKDGVITCEELAKVHLFGGCSTFRRTVYEILGIKYQQCLNLGEQCQLFEN